MKRAGLPFSQGIDTALHLIPDNEFSDKGLSNERAIEWLRMTFVKEFGSNNMKSDMAAADCSPGMSPLHRQEGSKDAVGKGLNPLCESECIELEEMGDDIQKSEHASVTLEI